MGRVAREEYHLRRGDRQAVLGRTNFDINIQSMLLRSSPWKITTDVWQKVLRDRLANQTQIKQVEYLERSSFLLRGWYGKPRDASKRGYSFMGL